MSNPWSPGCIASHAVLVRVPCKKVFPWGWGFCQACHDMLGVTYLRHALWLEVPTKLAVAPKGCVAVALVLALVLALASPQTTSLEHRCFHLCPHCCIACPACFSSPWMSHRIRDCLGVKGRLQGHSMCTCFCLKHVAQACH